MRSSIILALSLSASSLSLACGSDAPPPGSGDGGPKATGPVLPWKVGNRWTYRVTDGGTVTTKETIIEEETTVGGDGPNASKLAYRVVTRKQDGQDQTVSWQIDEGDRVLRYREQSFHASTGDLELEEYWDPYKLHIDGTDEHTELGVKWLESYDETKAPVGGSATTGEARDLWSVDGVGEEVTVPFGTFGDCIIYQKVGGSSPKLYWYVRGVGKVKETGSQTEELVDYELSE